MIHEVHSPQLRDGNSEANFHMQSAHHNAISACIQSECDEAKNGGASISQEKRRKRGGRTWTRWARLRTAPFPVTPKVFGGAKRLAQPALDHRDEPGKDTTEYDSKNDDGYSRRREKESTVQSRGVTTISLGKERAGIAQTWMTSMVVDASDKCRRKYESHVTLKVEEKLYAADGPEESCVAERGEDDKPTCTHAKSQKHAHTRQGMDRQNC